MRFGTILNECSAQVHAVRKEAENFLFSKRPRIVDACHAEYRLFRNRCYVLSREGCGFQTTRFDDLLEKC